MLVQYIFGEVTSFLLICEFILCSAFVIVFGVFVAKYGDQIAEEYNLSRAWLGFIVIAAITSAPELVSSIGSITLLRAPNLAFGNIFGSNIFNLMIICVLEAISDNSTYILSLGHYKHVLPAFFGILIMLIAIVGIAFIDVIADTYYYIFSILIGLTYLFAIYITYKSESKNKGVAQVRGAHNVKSLLLKFSMNGFFIIICGLWLIQLADIVAIHPFYFGAEKVIFGQSFVGTILLAFVTSLPELVISIVSIRIGALDMAIGNIFGSNLFNVFFITFLEVIYLIKYKTYIFYDVSRIHIYSALLAIALTATTIIATLAYSIKRGSKKTIFGWDTIAMMIIFVLGMIALYRMR